MNCPTAAAFRREYSRGLTLTYTLPERGASKPHLLADHRTQPLLQVLTRRLVPPDRDGRVPPKGRSYLAIRSLLTWSGHERRMSL